MMEITNMLLVFGVFAFIFVQCNCFWSFNRIHAVIIWHQREQCSNHTFTNAKALVCSRRVAGSSPRSFSALLLPFTIFHNTELKNWAQFRIRQNEKWESCFVIHLSIQTWSLLQFTKWLYVCSFSVKQLNLPICRQREFSELMQTILKRRMLGIN